MAGHFEKITVPFADSNDYPQTVQKNSPDYNL